MFVHDRSAVSITVGAYPRITDVYRSRGPGMGVVMMPMMMATVVMMVTMVVLAHGNMLLEMVVLAWFSAKTHLGRRFPVLVVPSGCGCCEGHVD